MQGFIYLQDIPLTSPLTASQSEWDESDLLSRKRPVYLLST